VKKLINYDAQLIDYVGWGVPANGQHEKECM
jgi:hypothetical protein